MFSYSREISNSTKLQYITIKNCNKQNSVKVRHNTLGFISTLHSTVLGHIAHTEGNNRSLSRAHMLMNKSLGLSTIHNCQLIASEEAKLKRGIETKLATLVSFNNFL